jgi:hypothetical protein
VKITTLVPAFKVEYLPDLLEGLSRQTVLPREVIVSDDTPTGDFIKILDRPEHKSVKERLNLTVVPGPKLGVQRNLAYLFQMAGTRSDLLHMHLDDDIIYPTFYEIHQASHQQMDTLCTISRRWYAVESGRPMGSASLPLALSSHVNRIVRIDEEFCIATTIPNCINWLGEFSNAVFRPEILRFLNTWEKYEVATFGLEDLGAFLWAAERSPLVFINEHLGAFRLNPRQHSQNLMGRQMKLSHLSWIAMAIAAKNKGKLTPKHVNSVYSQMGPRIIETYRHQSDMKDIVGILESNEFDSSATQQEYLNQWRKFTEPER